MRDARTKIDTELWTAYESIDDEIQERARRVKTERLVTRCKDLLMSAISKNDQLLALAAKTKQAEKNKEEVEEWLDIVNKRHDDYMKNAREYLDSVLVTDCSSKLSHHSKKSSACRTASNASTLRRKNYFCLKSNARKYKRRTKPQRELPKENMKLRWL